MLIIPNCPSCLLFILRVFKSSFICINIQSFLLSLLATTLNLDDLKLSPIETFLPTHNFTHQGQNPSDLILTIPQASPRAFHKSLGIWLSAICLLQFLPPKVKCLCLGCFMSKMLLSDGCSVVPLLLRQSLKFCYLGQQMCVYLTDVPISNVLLSAQSRCFCMYCNFSFDLRLLLCIVSKAYQARCCACVLINILFFPEFQESSLEFIYSFTPHHEELNLLLLNY